MLAAADTTGSHSPAGAGSFSDAVGYNARTLTLELACARVGGWILYITAFEGRLERQEYLLVTPRTTSVD